MTSPNQAFIDAAVEKDACTTCNIYYDFEEGNQSATFEQSVDLFMNVLKTDAWSQYMTPAVNSKFWCGCACEDPTYRPVWLSPFDVCAFAKSGQFVTM